MLKKILLFSLIAALLLITQSNKETSSETHDDSRTHQATFNSLPPQLQTLIKNTFTLDSYQIFENKAGTITAANRAQNLKASFSQDKTQIQGTRSANSWELNLHLTGFGWQNEIKSVDPGILSYKKNRVEIKRPSLTEWFVNDMRGLEQGFTIDTPPQGQGTQLVLQLSVNSNLQSQISENKKDINLSNKTNQSINYSGLIAKDAQGKELNTWFESQETPKGTTWQIFVDVKDAQFPILVDPVINEDQIISPPDIITEDRFGIEAVAISGNTVIIGAPGDDDPVFGNNSGSAYIFVKDPTGVWVQQAKLLASDAAVNAEFGRDVAIENDTAIIGAPNTQNSGSNIGAAYIFVRDAAGMWTQQQRLDSTDLDAGFGSSVDISGETVAILAPLDATPSQTFIEGSVYIFVRNTGVWTQQAKLKTMPTPPLTLADGGKLDGDVAISSNTVVVSNFIEDHFTGAARIFVRTGTSWAQQASLTANDGAAGNRFGENVDIFGDTVVLGASGDDDNGQISGSAYIFVRDTSGIWSQQAKLLPSDGQANSQFGSSVSISGETVLIMANIANAQQIGFNSTIVGQAYTFNRSGTVWTEQLKLSQSLPANPIDGTNTLSGVALSNTTAIIGTLRSSFFPIFTLGGDSAFIYNIFCQKDLGFQGPGDLTLCVCGDDLTQANSTATITISGATPLSSVFVVLGFNNSPTPFSGGTIVPSPPQVFGPFPTDTLGTFKMPITGGSNGPPITFFLQAGGFDGPVFEISNAVEVKIGF